MSNDANELDEDMKAAVDHLRQARNALYRISWSLQEPVVERIHSTDDTGALPPEHRQQQLASAARMSQVGAVYMLAMLAAECAKRLEAIRRDVRRSGK